MSSCTTCAVSGVQCSVSGVVSGVEIDRRRPICRLVSGVADPLMQRTMSNLLPTSWHKYSLYPRHRGIYVEKSGKRRRREYVRGVSGVEIHPRHGPKIPRREHKVVYSRGSGVLYGVR